MAAYQEHLKKAKHNEKFFNEFDITITLYRDWIVTAIFYSALHYIRALASKYGYSDISSYGEMDNLFSRIDLLKMNQNIYNDYRQLKDDSRDARYDMLDFNPIEVTNMIDNEFNAIKSFVVSNIN